MRTGSMRRWRKSAGRCECEGLVFPLPHPTKPMIPVKPSPSFLILTGLLLWALLSQLVAAFSWGHGSFQMTEWLINYSGGFVRRGLPGSLIGICADATGIQANHLVITFSVVCYLALAIWFLRRASGAFPAILLLSCIVMGFPAYQDSIVRKDCLGLLLLVACLAVDRGGLPRIAVILSMNVLSGVAILSHETFVFYALAGLVLLRRGDEDPQPLIGVIRRGVVLLPAAACFLLTVIFYGTPAHAQAVNDSWLPLWRAIDPTNTGVGTPAAAIEALGWTSEKGLSLSIYMLTSGLYQPLAWFIVFAVSFGLVVLFTPAERRAKVTALLLAQLVFISPLFLLGVDYGRWLFLWVASTVILHIGNRNAPIWLESRVAYIFGNVGVARILGHFPAKNWYLLLFGVPVCWNIFNFMTASPLGRHLYFLWSSLR